MKLLIADDHTLFRDALVQYIQRAISDAEVVLAKDLYEVKGILASQSGFNLVVLDFRMPGMNGFEGLEHVLKTCPQTPVAMMSGVAEKEDVKKAMDMGAKGYFPKTMSGKSLLGAIQEVISGKTYIPFDSQAKDYMPTYYNDPAKANGADGAQPNNNTHPNPEKAQEILRDLGLTPREREIVTFLTTGSANKDIAQALNLQVVTVKLHVRSICRKLGVKNRTQAALKLRDCGMTSTGTE